MDKPTDKSNFEIVKRPATRKFRSKYPIQEILDTVETGGAVRIHAEGELKARTYGSVLSYIRRTYPNAVLRMKSESESIVLWIETLGEGSHDEVQSYLRRRRRRPGIESSVTDQVKD